MPPLATATSPLIAAVVPALFTLVPWLLQYVPKEPPTVPPRAPRLKVMTANVMILNDWYTPLIEQAKERKPDVLLIQEFAPDWAAAINRSLGPTYPNQALVPSATDSGGLGLYSRYPILSVSNTTAPGRDGRPQQRVVIDLGGGR